MIRPGHHRPLGTTTVMRFPDWPHDHPVAPRLGDIARQTSGPVDDSDHVQRAYLVVGVAETASGYRLTMERIPYERPEGFEGFVWTFYNLPRR